MVRPRRLLPLVAAVIVGATFLYVAPAPAQAAPIGQGFTITPADLA